MTTLSESQMQNIDVCREIVRQLWPYLDGVLSDDLQERVVAHLSICVNCSSHFDFEQAFLDAVRATESTEVDVVALQQRVVTSLVAAGMSVR